MTFGSPPSTAMMAPTLVALVVAVATCAAARWVAIRRKDKLRQRLFPVLVGVWVALYGLVGWVNYMFSPIGYEVSEYAMTVRMRGCRKTILLNAIRGARVDTQREYAHAYSPWRMLTSSAFMYSGPFGLLYDGPVRGAGRAYVYVTDPRRAVILEGQPLVIVSPDQPEAFVAAVQQALVPSLPSR